jgi:hypothetical protein
MRACLELLAERFGFTLELEEFDTEINRSHDVTNPALWGSIMKKIQGGFYDVVFRTPPCGPSQQGSSPTSRLPSAWTTGLAKVRQALGVQRPTS